LPKQFLPASDRGCPWKATRRGGLLLLTGVLNLPVAGHSRHFGSSADYFRSSLWKRTSSERSPCLKTADKRYIGKETF
jgi:hypothetical protein